MNVYLVVFEHNPLELVDHNAIYLSPESAEIVRQNYQVWHDSLHTGRKIIVRKMYAMKC